MTQVDPVPQIDRLRQALAIGPEGGAGFRFVGRPSGDPIRATHRGTPWLAYALRDSLAENPTATSFARAMGWDGPGVLTGTIVFVGDQDVEDVPGVLMAEAMRHWGDLQVT